MLHSDTKVKQAALSPTALTIGCDIRQKIWNCQAVKTKIFFTAMGKETISKRLET